MGQFSLTIKDMLNTKAFEKAKVLAGENGLNKQFKWTHIIESIEFDSLLNGEELILTTGMGLNLDSSLDTYEKLLKKNVTGICIEAGPHFSGLPTDIKQFADHHHFPIIVFEEVVRFVDITQELHTLIINQHHKMLYLLSDLTKVFTELSLAPNGILKILQKLNRHFIRNAFFISNEVKNYYSPPEAKEFKSLLSSYLFNEHPSISTVKIIQINNKNFAVTPVHVLGQIWGYLCMENIIEEKGEFLFSVLERAAISISQILLRNKTYEERKLNEEDDLVQNLLFREINNPDEINFVFPNVSSSELQYRIFIYRTNSINRKQDEWEEFKLQKSMTLRSLFNRHHVTPAISIKKLEVTIICFSNKSQNNLDIQQFEKLTTDFFGLEDNIKALGISDKHHTLANFSTAYKEANEVIQLNKLLGERIFFYERIGVYQLLFQLHNNDLIKNFINDHIGPLIEYDERMNTELLQTIETYLEHNEGKKVVADRLYIVRQTLYHRLDKIEELLGETFLEPMNRLAIEIAIKLYRINAFKIK